MERYRFVVIPEGVTPKEAFAAYASEVFPPWGQPMALISYGLKTGRNIAYLSYGQGVKHCQDQDLILLTPAIFFLLSARIQQYSSFLDEPG